MRLQYRLTDSDFLDAQSLHAKRGIVPVALHFVIYFVSPAAGLFFCFGVFAAAKADRFARFDWVGLTLGVFWIVLPLLYRRLLVYQFRRTRTGQGDSVLTFEADKIHCADEHTKSEIEWKAIRRFSENKKVVLLYLAAGKFIVIPKRVCSPEQIEELRQLFQAKISAR